MDSFTRRRKPEIKRRIVEVKITVRTNTMSFNNEVTKWLGVYLDSGLQFRAHKSLTLKKATYAEDKVGHLAAMRSLARGLVR